MQPLALPASLTLRDARAVLSSLESAIAGGDGPTVAVDAGALDDIDSSALAVLLECRRLAAKRQRGFELHRAPPRLVALAELYGVAELLHLQAPAQPDATTASAAR